eukprot:scaffold14307_cov177-Cylindrotheca_fusiformis.AAC.1
MHHCGGHCHNGSTGKRKRLESGVQIFWPLLGNHKNSSFASTPPLINPIAMKNETPIGLLRHNDGETDWSFASATVKVVAHA